MEFDVWIPSLHLCFEFQDPYHYVTTWYYHKGHETIQQRDDMKKLMALEKGMYFIDVPCWWDGSTESLVGSIHFARPDLILSHAPITLNPPESFFQSLLIPDVGELMLASFPLDEITEFRAWWMGEKYDGIRCCWNPTKKYSRNGREIELMPPIIHQLPAFFIDAEFWFGRGQFMFTYPMFKGSPDINWPQLRMVLFDIPSHTFELLPFEKRFGFLLSNVPIHHPFTDKIHMREAVKGVIEHGGEGIIMRKVKSLYERGRTSSLLKVKAAVYDMEAIVVGKGEKNSVQLKLPNGKTFEVPANDVSIPTPQIGDIVSFSSESHARRELPVVPKIFKIRTDVSWTDVLRSYAKEQQFLNASSKVEGFTTQPIRHWDVAKMRSFMEKFAREKNMDPLIPATWYNTPYEEINSNPSGKSILAKFFGNYYKALRSIFPDMKLDAAGFSRSLWSRIENRREFFASFARHNEFNPTIAENWYTLDAEALMDIKGASKVIAYHEYSPYTALLDLFPNLGLEISKFRLSELHLPENRKKFFESYARDHGFDPYIPDNWYSQLRSSIMETKGAGLVLSYYHNSVKAALVSLFPDIGLNESKFDSPLSLWGTVSSRRKFFDNYATENRFDPLDPEIWYFQPRHKLLQKNGAHRVLFYHNNSVPQALLDLFPEIGWDKTKLRISWYREVEARRDFFEEYARQHSFNALVPEQWYRQPVERIIASQGARRVLSFYNNSLPSALRDVFPQLVIDPTKFNFSETRWSKPESRRKFFENYAKENKFDPLNPQHWYSHARENILKHEGTTSVLFYHNNSLGTAISDLFPEIGFSRPKYKQQRNMWRDESDRRKFFEEFADQRSFDYRDPNNWYSQVSENILAVQGARGVLAYHNNSIQQALMDLFPDIGLSPALFQLSSEWRDIRTRRKFFDDFAKTQQFDTHVPENWYSQSIDKIMSLQGITNVLSHHNNNVPKALADLYPDIGLNRSKFNITTKWQSPENRREFFEMYAKENRFDPLVPQNWYLQSPSKILAIKSAKRVLFYHNNSVPKAILELFPSIGLRKRKLFSMGILH